MRFCQYRGDAGGGAVFCVVYFRYFDSVYGVHGTALPIEGLVCVGQQECGSANIEGVPEGVLFSVFCIFCMLSRVESSSVPFD